MNPKVFVSHASEDKDRFVNTFATKLRENGVDAWLDKWVTVSLIRYLKKVLKKQKL